MITMIPEWVDEALCAQVDVGDLFFPGHGHSSEPALSICRACPVRQICLDAALDHKEIDDLYGVFGGQTARSRRALRRERRQPHDHDHAHH